MVLPPSSAIERARSLAVRIAGQPTWVFAIAAAIYLALCFAAFFVFRPTTVLYFTDYWEHRAFVEEVIRHGTNLSDPIYGEAASSRQFTPWILVLGYLCRLTGISSDQALAVGAMLVSLLFVGGVFDFARTYFRKPWAPVLLFVVLTCFWGPPGLLWTGFYALRSQLHSNYYPAELVFALTFLAWAQMVRLLQARSFRVPNAILFAGIVAFSFLAHPLNAGFLIAGSAGLAVFEPKVSLMRRASVLLVLAAAILLAALWPYFNLIDLAGRGVKGADNFNNYPFFFHSKFVIRETWPALLGAFTIPWLVRDRNSIFLVAAFVAILAAYVGGGIIDMPVSHRFLAYVVLALQLMIVYLVLNFDRWQAVARLTVPTRRIVQGGGASLVLILIIAHLAFSIEQFVRPWARADLVSPVEPVAEQTHAIAQALPPGARVMAFSDASLVLPSFGVHVVAFCRPMVLSPTDHQRQIDYYRFFTPGVSTEERKQLAARWGATHVAYLDFQLSPKLAAELAPLGPVAITVGPWRVIVLK